MPVSVRNFGNLSGSTEVPDLDNVTLAAIAAASDDPTSPAAYKLGLHQQLVSDLGMEIDKDRRAIDPFDIAVGYPHRLTSRQLKYVSMCFNIRFANTSERWKTANKIIPIPQRVYEYLYVAVRSKMFDSVELMIDAETQTAVAVGRVKVFNQTEAEQPAAFLICSWGKHAPSLRRLQMRSTRRRITRWPGRVTGLLSRHRKGLAISAAALAVLAIIVGVVWLIVSNTGSSPQSHTAPRVTASTSKPPTHTASHASPRLPSIPTQYYGNQPVNDTSDTQSLAGLYLVMGIPVFFILAMACLKAQKKGNKVAVAPIVAAPIVVLIFIFSSRIITGLVWIISSQT